MDLCVAQFPNAPRNIFKISTNSILIILKPLSCHAFVWALCRMCGVSGRASPRNASAALLKRPGREAKPIAPRSKCTKIAFLSPHSYSYHTHRSAVRYQCQGYRIAIQRSHKALQSLEPNFSFFAVTTSLAQRLHRSTNSSTTSKTILSRASGSRVDSVTFLNSTFLACRT